MVFSPVRRRVHAVKNTSYVELDPALLRAHEVVDHHHLADLAESITALGVCVPVAVARFGGEWIVVDGAHRTQAAVIVGLASVPCRVLQIPPDRPVDGWARRYRIPVWLEEATAVGSVLASCAATGGQVQRVGAPSHDPRDLWETAWRIERQLPREPYVRRQELEPGSFCWQPPAWGVIAECALRWGPWPAGFTNFHQALARPVVDASPTRT